MQNNTSYIKNTLQQAYSTMYFKNVRSLLALMTTSPKTDTYLLCSSNLEKGELTIVLIQFAKKFCFFQNDRQQTKGHFGIHIFLLLLIIIRYRSGQFLLLILFLSWHTKNYGSNLIKLAHTLYSQQYKDYYFWKYFPPQNWIFVEIRT